MTMVGADTAELADLASEFGDAADELARRLARSIDRTDSWQGPDADRCKDQWTDLAQTQMRQVADELTTASRHLRINAWAQDIASGDTNLFTILVGSTTSPSPETPFVARSPRSSAWATWPASSAPWPCPRPVSPR